MRSVHAIIWSFITICNVLVAGEFAEALPPRDLLRVFSTGSTVQIAIQTSGGYQVAYEVPAINGAIKAATSDFDNDGDLDFVVLHEALNYFDLIQNNGNDTFTSLGDRPIFGYGGTDIEIGDINNDGKQDLIFTNLGAPPYWTNSGLTIYFGDGAMGFPVDTAVVTDLLNFVDPPALSFYLGAPSTAVTIGDFNGDGLADLAVNKYASVSMFGGIGGTLFGGVSILVNSGGVGSGWLGLTPFFEWSPCLGSLNCHTPGEIAAGHFAQGPGDDLVVVDNQSHRLLRFKNLLTTAPGNFEILPPTIVPGPITDLVAGKFNGDSLRDVAFLVDNPQGADKLAVWFGVSSFSFTEQVYNTTQAPRSLSARDITGDGTTDLMCVSFSPDQLNLFLNNGAGQFSAQTIVATSPVSFVVGDFRGSNNSRAWDSDGDGVYDYLDCAPQDGTKWQSKAFPDSDGDGVRNSVTAQTLSCFGTSPPAGYTLNQNGPDNCANIANADQANYDGDALGDLCDSDDDNDGAVDASDCAPFNATQYQNTAYSDSDNDGVRDSITSQVITCFGSQPPTNYTLAQNGPDNCLNQANANQLDSDGDLSGDACDLDDDNDGYSDDSDCAVLNAQLYRNLAYLDGDGDGVRDTTQLQLIACFGSTIPNGYTLNSNGPDNCQNISNSDQTDSDGDGFGDSCDGGQSSSGSGGSSSSSGASPPIILTPSAPGGSSSSNGNSGTQNSSSTSNSGDALTVEYVNVSKHSLTAKGGNINFQLTLYGSLTITKVKVDMKASGSKPLKTTLKLVPIGSSSTVHKYAAKINVPKNIGRAAKKYSVIFSIATDAGIYTFKYKGVTVKSGAK